MGEGIGKNAGEFFSELVTPGVVGSALSLGMLWMSGCFGMFGGSAGLSSGEVEDNGPQLREAVEPELVISDPYSGYWSCN